MKKSIKLLSLLLAFLTILASFSVILTGCDTGSSDPDGKDDQTTNTGNGTPGGDTPGDDPDPDDPNNTTYTVLIKTRGGMKMEGISVNVHHKATGKPAIKAPVSTGKGGAATFTLPTGEYYATLSNVPAGYEVDEKYPFRTADCVIELTSSVIKPEVDGEYETPAEGEYKLGSVMKDFKYTDTDGNTYVLSEMLEYQNGVLLNFWYTTCGYCVDEFPLINEAYNSFGGRIEVLALNNYEFITGSSGNTPTDIANFKTTYELSLPMVYDQTNLMYAFDYSEYAEIGYPISVMIDRYGVVCMIAVGAITTGNGFQQIFKHFDAEDYQQILVNSIEDIAPVEKPTEQMPPSEEVAGVLNGQPELDVFYYPETGDDTIWPFLITEKDGIPCVAPSNINKPSSWAILYADITLKKGDVLAFDYFASSELNADILTTSITTPNALYTEDMYNISGYLNGNWKTCYTYVAPADGTYTLTFRYGKDSSIDDGDDTVYIKNLRIVTVDDIDVETYIPRNAATDPADGGEGYNSYVEIFFNKADGYYHVGSENGPILLANLLGPTIFNSGASSLNDYNYNNKLFHDYFETETTNAFAEEFYAEAVSGGYKLYRFKDGNPEYLDITYNATLSKPSVAYKKSTNTVFSYDAESGAWLVNLKGVDYYLGSHGALTIVDVCDARKQTVSYYPVGLIDHAGNAVTAPEENTAYYLAFKSSDDVLRYLKGTIKDLSTQITEHMVDASNSLLNSYTSVNEELRQLLMKTAELVGDGDELHPDLEWLQVCRYYDAYGTDKQLQDPIKGLSYHSAFPTVEDDPSTPEVEKNEVVYDGRILMPRGLLYKFVPAKSGVYQIQSYSSAAVEAWIFMDHQTTEVYTYEDLERNWNSPDNCNIYFYMEAGTAYYIDVAFADIYASGTLSFSVSYVDVDYQLLRYCSNGFWIAADGDTMDQGNLLTGGLMKIVYDELTDRFYEYYGNDKTNRNPMPIYVDFTRVSPLISPDLWNLILWNGCDFSKTQDDEIIINYMKLYPTNYEEELQTLWGENYDQQIVEDVKNGIYHGTMIDYSKTDLDVKILEYIKAYPETYKTELQKLLGDKYDETYVDDVVAGNYHGSIMDYAQGQITAGIDYTDIMKNYLPTASEDGKSWIYPEGWIVGGELDGCMEVNMELATILQHIIDKYSYQGIENAWTKLCVYYQQINAETAIRG